MAEKADAGNEHAKAVMQSWADAEWFTSNDAVPESIKVAVFKATGEINTDDLSPAQDAWSRPDIPLHARAMFKMTRDGMHPEEHGVTGPMTQIDELKARGLPVAFIGDVVGTGSSRKSATNSVLWFFGEDMPGVPNKRSGGICFGSKVAPIFFNTMEDAGALVFEAPVDNIANGDVITIYPYEGKILNEAGEVVSEFEHKSEVILDEVQADGRINLIIGRGLTQRAREHMGLPPQRSSVTHSAGPIVSDAGFTPSPENGRQSLWHRRHPPRHLLRAQNDHRWLSGHHWPHDQRRTERSSLPGFLNRSGDAVFLSHSGLPQAR